MKNRNFALFFALVAFASFAVGCNDDKDDGSDYKASATACSSNESCGAYKYCDLNTGHCLSKQIGGVNCSSDIECLGQCHNGQCTCTDAVSCNKGYECDTSSGFGMCKLTITDRNLGESCTKNSECKSNFCLESNVCACNSHDDCSSSEYCNKDHACTAGKVQCPDDETKDCLLIVDVRPNVKWANMTGTLTKDMIVAGETFTNDMTVIMPNVNTGVTFCAYPLYAMAYKKNSDGTPKLDTDGNPVPLTAMNVTVGDAFNLLDVPYVCNIIHYYDNGNLTKLDADGNCKPLPAEDSLARLCLADNLNQTVTEFVSGIREVRTIDGVSLDCRSAILKKSYAALTSDQQASIDPPGSFTSEDEFNTYAAAYSDFVESSLKSGLFLFMSAVTNIYNLIFDVRLRSRKDNIGCVEFPLDSPFSFKFKYNDGSQFVGHDFVTLFSIRGSDLLSSNFKDNNPDSGVTEPGSFLLSYSNDYLDRDNPYHALENLITPTTNETLTIHYEVDKCDSLSCKADGTYSISWKSNNSKDANINCSDLKMATSPIACTGTVTITGNTEPPVSATEATCNETHKCKENGQPIQEIVISNCNTSNAANACITTPMNFDRYRVYVVL